MRVSIGHFNYPMKQLDRGFSNDAQLSALVQLRIYQDDALYKRINLFLIVNSLMTVAYFKFFIESKVPAMAIVVAFAGFVVNFLLRLVLIRQNNVLNASIRHLSTLWTINAHLEALWGVHEEDECFLKKCTHARYFLTHILPFLFLIVWFYAFWHAVLF